MLYVELDFRFKIKVSGVGVHRDVLKNGRFANRPDTSLLIIVSFREIISNKRHVILPQVRNSVRVPVW